MKEVAKLAERVTRESLKVYAGFEKTNGELLLHKQIGQTLEDVRTCLLGAASFSDFREFKKFLGDAKDAEFLPTFIIYQESPEVITLWFSREEFRINWRETGWHWYLLVDELVKRRQSDLNFWLVYRSKLVYPFSLKEHVLNNSVIFFTRKFYKPQIFVDKLRELFYVRRCKHANT
ncbi:hypothetical protein KEJ32_02500 [Candidatus Bathyarchaeota archaeon]|nr:hypothetical protein [Candidatus Bathyarchaeota archaeon]